jgi:hypothetical protein
VSVGKSAPQAMRARENDTTIKDLFHVVIFYILLSSEYGSLRLLLPLLSHSLFV